MGTVTVGVVRERAPGERRVALVPETVTHLRKAGADVLVETGAGSGAWFTDADYTAVGATVVAPDELRARADAVLCVGPPDEETARTLRSGQTLIGLLELGRHPALAQELSERAVRTVSLDLLPRTLSRAQSMDALTSQANVAGYKAVLVAADAYDRFFPMLTTAAGTMRPAQVLVLGAGVAGLQAIATARRLGAVVTAYDVRPESRGEVESLGARFLDIPHPPETEPGAGRGGYARELSEQEQRAQREALNMHIARTDVVITTAQVPGRRPPLLVTAAAVERMASGSVVVDLAASELGGNVEGSEPDKTDVLDNGVTVIGAGHLPSVMATAASTAYARNLVALLRHLLRDGHIVLDPADEITAALTEGAALKGGASS
ncbi:NAD(P) transhydrogenase subunit alpha [Streptomyces europaeiscabiei]|uniref:NAD(P) transhydrogenase subunit alpha n=1 Tax=Streptomyces TaxID=1883 RepID=UPI000A3748D1|nr:MULTISPECIES: NAD(P) transhydrogenase subunit alpha [Streptomyces]MDX3637101.1 NAD(P) transhydrogenase subunit alpha [Streptomyces europaeiscabiei]MDX3655245.1 NAD(P) transhydrogenase subunit alpha [Streptomyces europaeiscabiei]